MYRKKINYESLIFKNATKTKNHTNPTFNSNSTITNSIYIDAIH